jgi:large subunit ribosomal protein L4e
MFAPTQIWRKWHRKVNVNQKRFAVASALAATAIPALVSARGHRIDQVPEVPLVVPSSIETLDKTKKALEVLEKIGGGRDVQKALRSRKLRAGKGKMRNRRHVARRGPLVVYNEDKGLTKAFRNIPGVELCQVERLNLLQLAPGGHLGRFVVWTQGAFERLDSIWGTQRRESDQKKGYRLPANIMANSDITRIINSDEVQSKLRGPIRIVERARRKKNPLKNLGAMIKLNPYAASVKRAALLVQRRAAAKDVKTNAKRAASLKQQKDAQKKHRKANIKARAKQHAKNFARITAE